MLNKKLWIVAALFLVAVSAAASNFRGADQVYVPVAGHLRGSSGLFVSDVYLSNLSGNDVDISVIYVPFGANPGLGEEFTNVITLRAYERKEYLDFFQTLGKSSAFGQLIFNGCLHGADCGPATQDEYGESDFFRPISVESRIYQVLNANLDANGNPLPGAPTTGQLFSGIPWYNFVSSLQASQNLDKVFMTGIRQTGTGPGTFRSNIGLVNASQWNSTTFVVTVYQGTMTAADQKGQKTYSVGPLGNIQINFGNEFPTLTGSNYFVTVEQRDNIPTADAPTTCSQGCPAFLAYASVLDNLSGDATTLEPQYLVPLDPAAINALYPSGSGKASIRRSSRH